MAESTRESWDLSRLLTALCIAHERAGMSHQDEFDAIVSLADLAPRTLVFVSRPSDATLRQLEATRHSIALLPMSCRGELGPRLEQTRSSIVLVENPRLVVAQLMAHMFPDDDDMGVGTHPTAHVHPDAVVHPSVVIGPCCQIGACEIGEGSRIGAFTTIKSGTVVGRRVTIREYCLIGGVGFGFVPRQAEPPMRIAHVGVVIIEDDVDIFPYVNVDRATFGETRIRRGARIDHYAHIGHNSEVGENCIVTAGVVLCGGSRLGKGVWAGVGSIVKQKAAVGAGATLGLGSVVLKDVEEGDTVAGIPAVSIRKKTQ